MYIIVNIKYIRSTNCQAFYLPDSVCLKIFPFNNEFLAGGTKGKNQTILVFYI